MRSIETYFASMSAIIRQVEQARWAAEPKQLDALVRFTERAYRRPLSAAEQDDLLAFYHKLRREDDLGHEEALRDALVSVLMSPHFCYRIDLADKGAAMRPLSDYALASRLSYFLWSSMPDAELLSHAAAGDLHQPDVLTAQTRRMLREPAVRGLATEFGGNWLDFRRFEEHNAVDRERFPSFNNELRTAMFEEPIRYFMDIAAAKSIRPGPPLWQRHFREPDAGPALRHATAHTRWREGGRGTNGSTAKTPSVTAAAALLPMAVFLTMNAPGLRTSPVERSYWVVRRLLGEVIPPPPPTVPALPSDEAKLGELTLPQVLARHRADKIRRLPPATSIQSAWCSRITDPIGERRTQDLGGRPVETKATFPDGVERKGLGRLRRYIHDKRQGDFVDNVCRKLFSYALGRSLLPSDQNAIDKMQAKLAAHGYAFDSLVEAIVATPQFLNKRGRDDPREK